MPLSQIFLTRRKGACGGQGDSSEKRRAGRTSQQAFDALDDFSSLLLGNNGSKSGVPGLPGKFGGRFLDGKKEQGYEGGGFRDFPGGLKAILFGHRKVEDHDVGSEPGGLIDGILAIFGLAANLPPGAFFKDPA
jgi:hypothetical protein